MLIFLEKRLTYLATPKTGSTAIEMALRHEAELIFAKSRKHLNVRRYKRRIVPFLARTFNAKTETVAILRNPVDQIRSWYKYRSRQEVVGLPRYTGDMSFDEFVLDVIAVKPPVYARVGTQYRFLSDRKGKVGIDHLFAYENQTGFVNFMAERLDCDIKLERKNVSPTVDAPLSPEVEARLRERRVKEFDLYNKLVESNGYLTDF